MPWESRSITCMRASVGRQGGADCVGKHPARALLADEGERENK